MLKTDLFSRANKFYRHINIYIYYKFIIIYKSSLVNKLFYIAPKLYRR